MPQFRRKVPFSGKAKKQQMQAKKQRQNRVPLVEDCTKEDSTPGENSGSTTRTIQKINLQPRAKHVSGNKYALQFLQETKEEILRRKEEARQTIEPITLEKQEISDNFFPPEIDLPKRPPWDFSMSKDVLEAKEQKYFTEYLKNIEKVPGLSYFELNLETWRQLWRVLEMSDILLIIVDIRYPVLLFPPYLYKYVTEDLGKDMILILNKIDLAPAPLVVAWIEYFKIQYPKLHILVFTSFPTYNLRGNQNDGDGLKTRRLRGKLKMAAEGAQKLLKTCEEIVGNEVDLSSWQAKIEDEMQSDHDLDELDRKDDVTVQKKDTGFFKHERFNNGILTIGCIGTPNVGKSSLMNALMGKKVVSVSRTPGHTKHFQTIFLTKTVCLCDCPGLVFPSTVPKQLQILMGSFPIAQVREPYTTIKFVGERIDLPHILKIKHQDNDDSWSAMDICDAWAAKKQYLTARTARFDSYRAANSLLRMALDGKISIYVYPPGWTAKKEKWETHPDVKMVQWIQARNKSEPDNQYHAPELSSEDESVEQNSGEDEGIDDDVDEEEDNSQDSDDSFEENLKLTSMANKFTALRTDKK